MIYKMNCSPWMGPSCFHKSAEDTWMRSSWECLFALHLLRTDTCSQGCIASIAWPFAVRVPPHYAAVTHGRVTHPGLTGDAGVTAFTLSSVMTRRSWLPRRSCPAVPRGARRAWWEKQMRNGTQCDRGDIEYHRPVSIARLSTSKPTLMPRWPLLSNRRPTRVPVLALYPRLSCRNIHFAEVSAQ